MNMIFLKYEKRRREATTCALLLLECQLWYETACGVAAAGPPKYLLFKQKFNFLNFGNYFRPEGVPKNVKFSLKRLKKMPRTIRILKNIEWLTYNISDLLQFKALK